MKWHRNWKILLLKASVRLWHRMKPRTFAKTILLFLNNAQSTLQFRVSRRKLENMGQRRHLPPSACFLSYSIFSRKLAFVRSNKCNIHHVIRPPLFQLHILRSLSFFRSFRSSRVPFRNFCHTLVSSIPNHSQKSIVSFSPNNERSNQHKKRESSSRQKVSIM